MQAAHIFEDYNYINILTLEEINKIKEYKRQKDKEKQNDEEEQEF